MDRTDSIERSSCEILCSCSLAASIKLCRILIFRVLVRLIKVIFESELLKAFLEHAFDLQFERIQGVHLLTDVHV